MQGWLTFVGVGLASGAAEALVAERLRSPRWVKILSMMVLGAILAVLLHAVPRPAGAPILLAAVVYGLSVSVGGWLAHHVFGAIVVESAAAAEKPASPDPTPIVPR